MEKEKLTILVSRAQTGDPQAMNDLMNETYETLYYYAYKTVNDTELAGDITQESCIEIMQSLKDLRDPGAFRTWAGRIVYHQCTRYFKKESELPTIDPEAAESILDQLPDMSRESLPEQVQEDKEFQKTILGMVEGLSPEHRSAMVLYYYENLSVPEIARIQGENEGTIKSRLFYGRKAIKKEVEAYEKRTGIRLHSSALLPLLLYFLLRQNALQTSVAAATILAKIPGAVCAANAATAGTAATATAAATTTATVAAATTTAGVSIGVKIAVAVAAVAIAASAMAGGVALVRNASENEPVDDDTYYEEDHNYTELPSDFNEEDLPEATHEEIWQQTYEEWFAPDNPRNVLELNNIWGRWSPIPALYSRHPDGIALDENGFLIIGDTQIPIYYVSTWIDSYNLESYELVLQKNYDDPVPMNIQSVFLRRHSDGLFELNIHSSTDDPNIIATDHFYQPDRYTVVELTPDNFFDYVVCDGDMEYIEGTNEYGEAELFAVTLGSRVHFAEGVGHASFVIADVIGTYIQRTYDLGAKGELLHSDFATAHQDALYINIYAADPIGLFLGEEIPVEELPATVSWQLWELETVTDVYGQVFIRNS